MPVGAIPLARVGAIWLRQSVQTADACRCDPLARVGAIWLRQSVQAHFRCRCKRTFACRCKLLMLVGAIPGACRCDLASPVGASALPLVGANCWCGSVRSPLALAGAIWASPVGASALPLPVQAHFRWSVQTADACRCDSGRVSVRFRWRLSVRTA